MTASHQTVLMTCGHPRILYYLAFFFVSHSYINIFFSGSRYQTPTMVKPKQPKKGNILIYVSNYVMSLYII